MTKVTSQALYKKNIEIKEKKKIFKDSKGRWRDDVLWKTFNESNSLWFNK